MKKQKFYHLTFVYSNFKYTFGRNVLRDILQHFFIPVKDRFDRMNDADFAGSFLFTYPTVQRITLIELEGIARYAKNDRGEMVINLDRYAITSLK